MKYFPITTKFVEDYDCLLSCIENLEHGSIFLMDAYKEIVDLANDFFEPLFPLFAIDNELKDLCPSLSEIELYYTNWKRILHMMTIHNAQWWNVRKDAGFYVSLGLDSFSANNLTFIIMDLLGLQDSVEIMIKNVGERYCLSNKNAIIEVVDESPNEEEIKLDKTVEEFKIYYKKYIEDAKMEFLLGNVNLINRHHLYSFYRASVDEKHLKSSNDFKQFVNDVINISPNHTKEGWNYQKIIDGIKNDFYIYLKKAVKDINLINEFLKNVDSMKGQLLYDFYVKHKFVNIDIDLKRFVYDVIILTPNHKKKGWNYPAIKKHASIKV